MLTKKTVDVLLKDKPFGENRMFETLLIKVVALNETAEALEMKEEGPYDLLGKFCETVSSISKIGNLTSTQLIQIELLTAYFKNVLARLERESSITLLLRKGFEKTEEGKMVMDFLETTQPGMN